jgi:PKD repeat protein
VLINLTFTYNGGSTTLAWYDDGNSCRYAESSTSPSLYDQPKSFYYINGYTGPYPLMADFIANQANRSYDTIISLTDLTTGEPASWNWTISPSTYYFTDGTSSSSQNPVVKFTSNGAYTVTLIVTRGTTGAVRIKTDYMFIGTPGLWTGLTSSEWGTGSNWHNFQVPAASIGITIAGTALHWPQLAGDLTLGEFCQDITVEGPAQVYVGGDLTISEGHSLTFTGSGILHIGGNWLNSGTFNMGSSTIDFDGPNDAVILGGASPETFYKISVSKTNSANLSIQGNINVSGTENP